MSPACHDLGMATVLLVCVVILVIAALVFGIVSLLTGEDPGLAPVEPDGRALPLPNHRSLTESDLKAVRFDLALRGYRMAQVDRALRRTAYDIGYKDEMIAVLEAEVAALREGRVEDADMLRKAREAAASPEPPGESDRTAGAEGAAEAAEAAEASEVDEDGAGPDPAHAESGTERADADAEATPPETTEAPESEAAVSEAAVSAASPEETAGAADTADAAGTGEQAAPERAEHRAGDASEPTDAAEPTDGGKPSGSAAAPAARSAPSKSTKRAARA
jgi:DivIVA domain-containing protein